ncbi:helix-turn-helix transcriptional regulator [Desulfofundulus sp. TPOSR]|jgi:transcriptional regulator with XRE-family HTH domain|uniref:Helix-turn-helix domain protein n=1 Tax=Desulfofundulus kuznetsovii (strain DSM 6115 / VKM B-1805 / 17) TaxID=760568 RepID=A0AAU8PR08_DESK7|nr:helix-turn-helix transcriptional regulator [Desulfofundulus sp. TPOSR]AEG15700.1 helix-turn-helix domain protein [Desulfofundulus kuznetsovii DSM 6115]NHM27640.1 helix-turn-helix transcriptional regulator [Desulfofundulus sp. TPOSR]
MSLEDVRKTQGLTAAAMATRVGITVRELLAIERGQQYPRLCVAQKWANALGLSFEEFSRHFYEKADPAQLLQCDLENQQEG